MGRRHRARQAAAAAAGMGTPGSPPAPFVPPPPSLLLRCAGRTDARAADTAFWGVALQLGPCGKALQLHCCADVAKIGGRLRSALTHSCISAMAGRADEAACSTFHVCAGCRSASSARCR